MVTAEAFGTTTVDTLNVAEVLPAGTITEAGTVAAEVSELLSAMSAPPVGAGLSVVTVPMLGFGPCTDAGLNVTLLTCICVGIAVTVLVLIDAPYAAVKRASIICDTCTASTVNCAAV